MIRSLILGFAASVAFGSAAVAQDEALPRPKLLVATGLATTETFEQTMIGDKESPVPFAVSIASSETVSARFKPEVEGALAAVEFAGPGNTFVESVVFTAATAEAEDPQDRAFALANLLVLRTFPSLIETFPDARILTFGRADVGNGLRAVQVIGTYTNGPHGPTVFRHVGMMLEGRPEVLIALINISDMRMPSRTPEHLDDTYSALALRSLRLLD